jgi:hypothetical protein
MELVDHEDGIPGRRTEIYSARTAVIVRRIGLGIAPIIAVVALSTLTPWLSMWWLLLLVPLLVTAVLIAATAGAAVPSNRSTRRRATASWAMLVMIDLALVIVSHWLASWLAGVLVVMATLGGLFAAGELVFNLDAAESSKTES